jgi:hypothetical protein
MARKLSGRSLGVAGSRSRSVWICKWKGSGRPASSVGARRAVHVLESVGNDMKPSRIDPSLYASPGIAAAHLVIIEVLVELVV